MHGYERPVMDHPEKYTPFARRQTILGLQKSNRVLIVFCCNEVSTDKSTGESKNERCRYKPLDTG